MAITRLEATARRPDTYAKVPTHGIGYGLLRFSPIPARPGWPTVPPVPAECQLSQSVHRQPGELFGLTVGAPIVLQSERAHRPYLIDVVASVIGEALLLRSDAPADLVARRDHPRTGRRTGGRDGELVDLSSAGADARLASAAGSRAADRRPS